MNLSLDSITEDTGSDLTIDSLKGQEKLPLGNDLSNTNRSVFTALASKKSGEDMVSMYQFFKNSLDINADDQPLKNSLQETEAGRRERDLGISGDMLVDPNVPEGVKATIPFYLQRRETPDPRKIVAEQALTEDNYTSGRLEGANQEAARMSSWIFGGENGVDANLRYKRDANALVLAAASKTDSSYIDMYFDLFAAITPGTEALNTAVLRERFGAAFGDDPNKPQNTFLNIFTQFSNKREMREMIDKLPANQRIDALKKALAIIQDQRGPGVFDGNEFSFIENARELIGDPDVAFSDQSETSSVVTDTLFNALSVIGLSPSRVGAAFKGIAAVTGKSVEKVVPKVIYKDVVKEGVTAPVQPAVAQATKQVEEKVLDVGGVHMTEAEIAEKRMSLIALSENKPERAVTKQLRSEQAAIRDTIAKLEAEKLANKENASQLAKDMKVSRKEAIRKTNKLVDEQIEEQQAKLGGIKDKLKYGERSYQAEADLSRFDQAVKAAKPVEGVSKVDLKKAISDALDEASAHHIVGSAKPSSVVSMLAETNPSKASAFVKAAVDDETGGLAKVISGTSREELAHDAISPSPSMGPAVRIKPVLDVDKGTLDLALADSGLRYTKIEMKSIADALKSSIANARGATLSTPMSQLIEDSEHGFKIKGLFIDGNTGFNNAQDALERTRFALQNEGVDMDSLTLMKRTEGGYEPVAKDVDVTALPAGDYAVQVDHNWNFHLASGFEKFDIKRNWLDWAGVLFNGPVSVRQGSVTRHIFSPQHMFHKDLMLATTTAFTRAAGITKRLATLADEFNKPFSKLSKKEQKELADYILKANAQRIPFDAPAMLGAGYTHDQVNVLSNWKRYWDTAFVLENADKVRTMKLTGWKMFLHKATNGELFVKPQGRNASISGKVYDPDLDMIVDLSSAGKKSIYDNGGTVAQLRDHVTDANGEVAKYVVVKNNVGSFTREFNETDMVLNYINGYYAVRHEAPLFVIQNVRDKSGRILYKRAIAEAGSLQEAEEMGKSIAARTQGHTYVRDGHDSADFFVREDVKTKDALGLSDARFDVGISSGRSTQRFRGAPLESYDPLASGQSQYVQNPLEAMQQTAFSLGNRLSTRPLIEGWKARYMEQFEDMLTVNPETHTKGFPTDPRQIGFAGQIRSKRLTDARTMWEYINQMEHGYESQLDNLTRSLIGIIADGVAQLPVAPLKGKGEAALRSFAGSGKASSIIRSSVYLTSLVAAHVATFLMQSAQALANLSLSFYDPRLYRDLSHMLGAALGIGTGESLARGKQLWKEWERTGHSAAVNIHSAAFLGGSGSGAVLGGTKASKPYRMAQSVASFIQGFYSKGELVNQYTAWLAKRLDFEAINKRAPSTERELEQIQAEAQLLTYNMNRSGQMAYNENTLNVQMQFFQVLHKAIFDPLFSRGMSAKDRIRLGIAPLVIFGLPLGVRNEINETVEGSGLSREDKEMAKNGLEWSLISKMLGAITPSLGELDYSRYNPLDPIALADRLGTLVTWPEMVTRTPGGGLVDRGLTALVTASRYLGMTTADSGIKPNDEAMWRSLVNLSAGTSNSFKGSLLLSEGVFRDKLGRTVVDEVDPVQAYAQWFGFTPREVLQTYEFNKEYIEVNEEFKEDVKTVIKNIREQLALNGTLSGTPEYTQQAVTALFSVFGNNPKARDELMTQLKYDLHKNGQSSYLYTVMKASGHLDEEQQNAIGVRIPDDKQRKAYFDLKDSINSGGEYK